MGNEYIISNVKRTNRNLFIVNVLLLAGVLAVVAFSMNYLYNVLFGPFKMNYNEIVSIKDPATLQKSYVEVAGDEVIDLDLHDITETVDKTTNEVKQTSIDTDYLLVALEDKFIVVNVPHGKAGTTFAGQLLTLPGDVDNEISKMFLEENIPFEDYKSMVLPLMIDASDFKTAGYAELIICSILFLIALLNLAKFVRRSSDPYAHPIYKVLSRYGEQDIVAKEIDNEIGSENTTVVDHLTITDTFLIEKKFFSLKFYKLSDLLWIYKKVMTHKTNFITTGKTYSVVVNTKHRNSIEIRVRKDVNADRVVEEVYNRIPWVAVGYSGDLVELWKKNFNELVDTIEIRKKQSDAVTEYNKENNEEPVGEGFGMES